MANTMVGEKRGWNNITANSPANSSGNNPGNSQLWYVDSGCSRHMTGEKSNFLSLTTAQDGVWHLETTKLEQLPV